LISGVRQLAAAKGVVIAAGKLGKFKTTFQDIIVISLLLYDEFPFRYLNPYLMILIEVLVYFTLTLSIASAVEYIVKNKGVLNLNDR
ncbi:MAG: CDP-diacylglycerol--glycerol-3-phosphate 3-phosphatidyltransferase, partial [Clostridia bacterium]|nr:CDP-diacylglycerol--glycerol-3-phosphate 3-phosphatidyltransferase [Clostridia bacterium]